MFFAPLGRESQEKTMSSPRDGFEKTVHLDYYEKVEITRDIAYGLLDDYYDERGWDVEKGVPTKEKLIELGLRDVAEDLEKLGIL